MEKHRITVVGLGPGGAGLITLAAWEALTGGQRVVLRTARHGVAEALRQKDVAFETLDTLYEECEDFDELCARAAARLADAVRESGRLVYGVSDPISDQTVRALAQACKGDIAVEIVPGVTLASYAAASCAALGAQTENLCVATALSIETLEPDPERPLMVTEIDGRVLASEVKLWLMELYEAEQRIFFAQPGEENTARISVIPLCELDRQAAYDHTCALLVPPVPYAERSRHTVRDLEQVMRRLRAPDGCPWDRAQTHESLRQYLIEEAYEAVDAIDGGDPDRVSDELGDVLLQVVFHAQIASEHAEFGLGDVATAICNKMISRHERLFGKGGEDASGDVGWEAVKRREKGQQTLTDSLRDVPGYLPALMHAYKVLRKAASAGVDPLSGAEAIRALRGALEDAQEALDEGKDASEALGRLLFAAAGAARGCASQPELLLRAETERFIARFERMEQEAQAEGIRLEELSRGELHRRWMQKSEK